jgi:general stress protein 26
MAKSEKLKRFYDLVDEIETAMMTTRRNDGLLVSRPMATQARADGADLWFVTWRNAPKVAEIRADRNINLAYFNNRTKEWVSVSGVARIVKDRAKIAELYRPDWRAWFGAEGGPNAGTPDDPRIVLIGVNIRFAAYLELNKPQPVVLFEVVRGMITGKAPKFPATKTIGKARRRTTAKTARRAGASRRRASR